MLLSWQINAQEVDSLGTEPSRELEVTDTTGIYAAYEEEAVPQDTVTYPFFSAISVLADYGKLAGLLMESESKYEFGMQIEFGNKFFIVGEYGYGSLNPNNAYKNADYQSEGQYYRVGLGYKIDFNPKNNMFFSLRYGASQFSDRGNIFIESPTQVFEPFIDEFERSALSASWYEIVMSSEVKVLKGLFAGFHARLRILNEYEEQTPLDTYSIPGYGRTIDESIPAFNLYLKYAFQRF